MLKHSTIIIVILSAFIVLSCGGGGNINIGETGKDAQITNSAPVISDIIVNEESISEDVAEITEAQALKIQIIATDIEGDALSYSWNSEIEAIAQNTLSEVDWTTPTLECYEPSFFKTKNIVDLTAQLNTETTLTKTLNKCLVAGGTCKTMCNSSTELTLSSGSYPCTGTLTATAKTLNAVYADAEINMVDTTVVTIAKKCCYPKEVNDNNDDNDNNDNSNDDNVCVKVPEVETITITVKDAAGNETSKTFSLKIIKAE